MKVMNGLLFKSFQTFSGLSSQFKINNLACRSKLICVSNLVQIDMCEQSCTDWYVWAILYRMKYNSKTCRLIKYNSKTCRLIKYNSKTCRLIKYNSKTCGLIKYNSKTCRLIKYNSKTCRLIKYSSNLLYDNFLLVNQNSDITQLKLFLYLTASKLKGH
jgi:hypothetical protein